MRGQGMLGDGLYSCGVLVPSIAPAALMFSVTQFVYYYLTCTILYKESLQ